MLESFPQNSMTLGLKLIFLGSLALFIIQILRGPRPSVANKIAQQQGQPILLAFRCILAPLFLLVLFYQASWQLTGFTRPKFVAFMQAYNRRDTNAARELNRGRIFDRGGQEIARNSEGNQRIRFYPMAHTFCHLLGYANPTYGLQGLERTEDAWLAGRHFAPGQEINQFARNMLDRTRITGNDLQITADARLQALATKLLEGRRGAVVALRPSDGAVLVLVSAPSFDPNQLGPALFANQQAQNAPLLNRALHGLYPPGSTFKMAMAALAIERGFNRELDCPPEGFSAAPGARPIRDHAFYENQRQGRDWKGYGRIGLREAFAKSSNVFFARLGVEMGAEAINASQDNWFFQRPIATQGIAREGLVTRPGNIPTLRTDERLRTAQLSIGQGELLVTPMQMALLTAAIANDGVAMRPRILEGTPSAQLGIMSSPGTANQVRSLMREVVLSGTARRALLPHLEIAGKTGTAQVNGGDDHAWFVCFAPYERPAIAIAVIVENGGYGSVAALPIATALLEEAHKLGLLTPNTAATIANQGGVP